MIKCSRNKLREHDCSPLDQATLYNLLLPSPIESSYLYNATLVIRLLESFIIKEECCVPLTRMRKITSLMDLDIAEVAAQLCLKPSKCLALVRPVL
uniref:NPH3 domain-containing protein n=1 Tax=Solanum lycopersicum TaxID=4081 RepID=A0A3Q7EVP8_SOLLC